MKEILIFAGTTEGRELSERLAAAGIANTLCVATAYGELVLKAHPLVTVHRGRMDRAEIEAFLQNKSFAAVADATHPYAETVTQNLREALENLAARGRNIPYFRLKREPEKTAETGLVTCFPDHASCAAALEAIEGNVLLTTGSKELAAYCRSEKGKERLFVRVLPGLESLQACMEQGIRGKQIIAMQGPFTAEMNEAIIRQFHIACLVTKQSGKTGGYGEKLEAAGRAGIPVFVVGRAGEEGLSFTEVCEKLETICEKKILPQEKTDRAAGEEAVPDAGSLEVVLAGVGMGGRNSLTREAEEAIAAADYLFGAERMLRPYAARVENVPFYRAEEILPYLQKVQAAGGNRKAVVLFSGDSGFYSGCQTLYQALGKAVEEGRLRASVRVLPGISSVAWLAACMGESYQDAQIVSIHGRTAANLAHRIGREEKTYLLLSGAADVRKLGEILLRAGLGHCEVTVGYQLSYETQQIRTLSPKDCLAVQEEGLYTCFIRNREAREEKLTHGLPDGAFLREKVPMTKEEVREVSICRLRLRRDSIVYDIGSGTGSIAVEIAGLSDNIQVYAIEQKPEAAALIGRNKERFGLENIVVREGRAPEALQELTKATHAFIGGSGGNLQEILQALYEKNPQMRVVLNAISLETICEIKELLSRFGVQEPDLVQMQVSRARKAGKYHLMQAENPVWICAFSFGGEESGFDGNCPEWR